MKRHSRWVEISICELLYNANVSPLLFFGTNQPTQLFIIQLRSLFATEIISYQV